MSSLCFSWGKKHLEAWLRPSAAAVGEKKWPPLENFRPPGPLAKPSGGLGPSLNEKVCSGLHPATVSLTTVSLVITPSPSINFVYQASIMWNKIRNVVKIDDFSFSTSRFKIMLKKSILVRQKLGDPIEWFDENFDLK